MVHRNFLTRLRRTSRIALAAGLLGAAGASAAQTLPCDQGIVRLPDRTGTVTICSGLAAQVPQLSRQLADAVRLIGQQGSELRELARFVKGLNAVGAGLDATRQGRMLASLSAELARAQRAGADRPRRTLEELTDQLDALRDQLIGNLGQERAAAATRQALRGPVGDSIAQLELRSAARQLGDIQQRLAALQSDVGEVKAGVATANEALQRIEKAVDPAVAADRCADLECALTQGASAASVQRLFDKGARLSGNAVILGEMLKMAALRPRPERLKVLEVLARNGVSLDVVFHPMLMDPQMLTEPGRELAESVWQAARMGESALYASSDMLSGDPDLDRWNQVAGCLYVTSRGVSLHELAALMGDTALFQFLREHDVELPERDLRCQVRLADQTQAVAYLRIDPQTGEVGVNEP